jgi:hypothetical protein
LKGAADLCRIALCCEDLQHSAKDGLILLNGGAAHAGISIIGARASNVLLPRIMPGQNGKRGFAPISERHFASSDLNSRVRKPHMAGPKPKYAPLKQMSRAAQPP